MYGNYTASSSNDPECATYPKSGGRTIGSALFTKKWGRRLNNCKPIPMTWDADDEDESESPPTAKVWEENDGSQMQVDEEHCHQSSWNNDSHADPVVDNSYEQHHDVTNHSGSYIEPRRIYVDNTYPAARPTSEVPSGFVPPEEDQETPMKPPIRLFPKTDSKYDEESWLRGILTKTPFTRPNDNSGNIFGDSGISVTSTKHTHPDSGKKTELKLSSRSLFTPVSREKKPNVQNTLEQILPSKNRHENEVLKKISAELSTPISSKILVKDHHITNDETPVEVEPNERQEVKEVITISKNEKVFEKYKFGTPNVFSEENKENFSSDMSSNEIFRDDEKKKLIRSQSHASLFKGDPESYITPSKNETLFASISTTKSLTSLFHGYQGAHVSRIPTPVRCTPHKQPQNTTGAAARIAVTSESDTSVESEHSTHKREDLVAERHPVTKNMAATKKVNDAHHQFGMVPVIHSQLSSNHGLTSQANKITAQPSLQTGIGSHPKPFGGFANHSAGNTLGIRNQEPEKSSDRSSNNLQHNPKEFSTDKGSNLFLNPNEALLTRFKDTQAPISHASDSVVSSTSGEQNALSTQMPRKAFSIRAPVFQVTSNANAFVSNAQPAQVVAPVSSALQSNVVHGPQQSSKTVEGNHQALHTQISSSIFHSANAAASKTHPAPTSHSRPVCSEMFNQNASQNQYNHPLSKTPVNHKTPQGLISAQQSGIKVSEHSSIPIISNNQVSQNASHKHVSAENPSAATSVAQARTTVSRPTSSQSNRKILMVNKRCYEVLNLLGKGASSKVYDVLDCQTNRCVAVKRVILRHGDPSVEGYMKEVDLLNQLKGSDSIIKLIDSEICLERGFKVLYMVMERGEMDLSSAIKLMSASKTPGTQESGPRSKIPLVTIIYYWVSMLNAVEEIHKKGIVHSDLKPANFLLVGGQIKLIDFGIATAVQTDVTSVIKSGFEGTPNYMSPEAIGMVVCGSPDSEDTFENPKASHKSDVWSLGCILYSLMYGRSPFQNITNERIKLDAIRNPNYAIPYPSNYSVHPPLLRALKRCLVRDYKQRASIAELKAIDYLRSSEPERETWDKRITSLTDKILKVLPPESKVQVLKILQEELGTSSKSTEET